MKEDEGPKTPDLGLTDADDASSLPLATLPGVPNATVATEEAPLPTASQRIEDDLSPSSSITTEGEGMVPPSPSKPPGDSATVVNPIPALKTRTGRIMEPLKPESAPKKRLKRPDETFERMDVNLKHYGPGGDPCPDCRTEHRGGVSCKHKNLYICGWRLEGPGGKRVWRGPLEGDNQFRKESKKAREEETVKQLAKMTSGKQREEFSALVRQLPEDATITKMRDLLLPETQRVWIQVANARRLGMDEPLIAKAYDIDISLVRRLIEDAAYIRFEAFFLSELSCQTVAERARGRLAGLIDVAIDGVEYWMKQLEDPKIAAVSLKACFGVLASQGVLDPQVAKSPEDAGRSKVTIEIPNAVADKLVVAIGRRPG